MGEGSRGVGDLDASFGATRAVAAKIEVQQLKASVRARLFGTSVDAPRLGEYSIRRRIGRGGMGAVYEAEDPRGRLVALKTLRGFSPAALFHLKHEFRALAGIVHPNLVSLEKLVVQGEQAYFTMELIDGVDFVHHVRGEAPGEALDASALARLRAALGRLVAGISALHAAGKLHRDIKPSNVLVTREGRVVLLDFGLVREITEVSTISSSNETFVGTPAYMAPETASGEPVGEAGDWYGLGVVLFEALTGELPFAGSGFQVVVEKCNNPPPRPSSRAAGVPADLDDLCLQLLAREPASRPTGDALRRLFGVPELAEPTRVIASPGAPIGRGADLERLRQAFAAVREGGAPRLLCLRGEPGIGKSTLLHAFADECQREHGALVLSGRCYTSETVPFRAFDPVIDVLTGALLEIEAGELSALLPADPGALVRLFPVLGRVPGLAQAALADDVEVDATTTLRHACEGLRVLLGHLAARQPIVLAIDDLQWGDADSAALLGELFGAATAPPLVVIFAVRAGDPAAAEILSTLADEHGVALEMIDVGPLAHDAAVAVVERLVAGAAAPIAAEAVVAEAGGSPLLIVEMVRHLLESPGGTAEDVRLEAVIRRRLAALDPAARRLLDVVALAGWPIDPEIAASVASGPGEARLPWAALRAANLIRDGVRDGDDVVEVHHDRIRELVVDMLEPGAQRTLHGRLGDLLVRRSAAPELVARHYRGAGRLADALPHTIAAGERAMAALAFRRAAGFFVAALDLCTGEASRRDLNLRAAEAWARIGRSVEAAAHYEEAATSLTEAEALPIRRAAALILLRGGEFERGLDGLRGVLAAVGEAWPRGTLRVQAALGVERLRLRLALRRASHATPTAEGLARLDTLAAAREGLSSADPIAAALFQARYLRASLEVGDPDHLAVALSGEAAFLAYFGSPRAERFLREARAMNARGAAPRTRESLHLCTAVVAFCEGDWSRTLSNVDAYRRLGLHHDGSHYVAAMGGFFELGALFFCGRFRELIARRRELVGWADEAGDRLAATTLRAGHQVFALLALDRPDEAAAELDTSFEGWPEVARLTQQAWAFHGDRAVDLYLGDRERAWERCAAAWPGLGRFLRAAGPFVGITSAFWRGSVAVAAAWVGCRRERLAVVDAMATAIARHGRAWGLPFADLLSAGAAWARGDRGAAAEAYASASRRFDRAGMALFAAAARWRLGEVLGGDDGRSLILAAERRLRAEDVRDPARIVATLAPGPVNQGS